MNDIIWSDTAMAQVDAMCSVRSARFIAVPEINADFAHGRISPVRIKTGRLPNECAFLRNRLTTGKGNDIPRIPHWITMKTRLVRGILEHIMKSPLLIKKLMSGEINRIYRDLPGISNLLCKVGPNNLMSHFHLISIVRHHC